MKTPGFTRGYSLFAPPGLRRARYEKRLIAARSETTFFRLRRGCGVTGTKAATFAWSEDDAFSFLRGRGDFRSIVSPGTINIALVHTMKHAAFFASVSLLTLGGIAPDVSAEVTGKEVTYKAGDTTLKGYLARDDAAAEGTKQPGVLVVHEWWGHNEYARKRARMLAGMGYVALAVDMYGDGKQASHPEDAGKFSSAVMQDLDEGRARFEAAMRFLQEQPQSDEERIAAIGYCFGGAVVLHMARFGLPLRGVASFHGNLSTKTPAEAGKVKAKVLVCHGADDKFIPEEQIRDFKEEMAKAGVTYSFNAYPGAVHSFTNPDADKFGKEFNIPLAYNKEADEKSWIALEAFLLQAFAE